MGTHPIFESDFDCLTESMNRSQPPNIIAAQQKLLEGISRQSAAQNSPEHMKLQQQLKLLGQQVKQLAGKHQLNQLRQAASPYARPASGTTQAKPPITQKYEDLVNVIEELGKDVRPTYAGSKSTAERLKRGLQHARQLVRESQAEAEKLVRSQN